MATTEPAPALHTHSDVPVKRLFAVVFASSIAFFIVVPLLPIYLAREAGADEALTWSGPVLAIGFIAGAVCSPIWGTLADRVGARRMMLRASVAVTATQAALVFATSPEAMFGVRLLHGCMAGLVPATMTYAVRMGERHGRDLSVLSVARSAGALVGPGVGGLVAAFAGVHTSFVVAAILTVICALIVLTLRPDNAAPESEARPTLISKLGDAVAHGGLRHAFSVVLLVSLLSGVLQLLIPLSVEASPGLDNGQKAFWVGVIFTLGGLAATLTGALWGVGADKYGWRRLAPVAAGGAAASVVIAAISDVPLALALSFLLFSLFSCEIGTLLNLYVLETTTAGEHGTFMGLMHTVVQSGFGVGPLVGGLLMSIASPSIAYGVVAVGFTALAVDMLIQNHRWSRHAPVRN